LVQNWPAPIVSDCTKACADRLGARFERGGHQDHGIDARHLGVNRDRLGTCRRQFHQRDAATARAGEPDRLDARIADQRAAEFAIVARKERERAIGHAAALDRRDHRARDQLAGSRVRRVPLDDHRAARGERRGGVAAGDREREREVRRAEHRDRADRHVDPAQVGPRQRRALGQRRIDRRVEPVTLANDLREQPQLPDRAPALTLEAGARQAGLGHRADDQLVADREDRFGASLEERRAARRVGR
jgi:hypothetical protein